jgi:SAM-dependent methyltransferase
MPGLTLDNIRCGGVSGDYTADYYLQPDGSPQGTFDLQQGRTLDRAQAMADALELQPGDHVLDYGCALGAFTLAFQRLGFPATGVDPSPCAIEHALPAARPLVQQLGGAGLGVFSAGTYAGVVAKDVYEHIPESAIGPTTQELLRVAGRLLLVIPTVGADGKFIFPAYEDDPTHITRRTGRGWFALMESFGFTVTARPDITPRIRRADKVAGTACMVVSHN